MPKIQVIAVAFLSIILLLLILKLKIIGFLGLGQIPMLDFDTYHRIASDVLRGSHPYELPYMQTLGPPLVILPFLPLVFLPLQLGRVIMIWTSLLAAASSCYLLVTKNSVKPIWPMTLMLLIFLISAFPTRFCLELGQPNLFATLLMTIVLTQTDNKKIGVGLALLTVVKTFFLISGLALLKSKWRAVSFALISGSVILIFSFIVLKPLYYYDYATKKVIPISLAATQSNNLDYYNQSLRSTLTRFHLQQYYLILLAIALLSTLSYLVISGDLQSSFILSILISPIIWQHYLAMIFPVIILIGLQLIKVKKISLFLTYLFGILLWWIELPWLHTAPSTLFNQILASHYFFSLMIFLELSIYLFLTHQTNFFNQTKS